MSTDTATPEAAAATAADAAAQQTEAETKTAAAEIEGEAKPPEKKEPEEDPAIRELRRELKKKERRIDSLTRRLYQQPAGGLQDQPIGVDYGNKQDDSETLSLSRAELERLAEQRALQLAPTLAAQRAAIERREGVYASLESDLGAEKFAELSRDLEAALDGLTDGQKRPKPVVDAIFESEAPRQLIEYLADPDNAAEADSLQRMSPLQLGRAIAKLETKLATKKAEDKPQPSKAAAPIEAIKGAGAVRDSSPQDSDSIEVWVQKERKRMAAMKR